MAITRALLSVSDKTGLVEFAQGLAEMGVELLSTGGTAKALRDAGLKVIDVSEYTGAPELFEGRLKTLHPMVHGGLLHRRDDPAHLADAKKHGIPPIDLVCVNLYPFEATVARAGIAEHEAIEQIDIGGPSMVRSAAKNHADVAVVTDPAQYAAVLADLPKHGGTTLALRRHLALAAFERTSKYDAAIAGWLAPVELIQLERKTCAPHWAARAALSSANDATATGSIGSTRRPSSQGKAPERAKWLSRSIRHTGAASLTRPGSAQVLRI